MIELWKYEGTANDFVVLEGDTPDLDLAPDAVSALCDRHRGVGADGVLLVLPGRNGARARMVVRNADGSRPEMCGNGIRCVALHLATRGGEVENASALPIETDAGVRTCRLDTVVDEREGYVTVDMGHIRVGEVRRVPFGGRDFALATADAGNPHAITFEEIDPVTFDALGARLQHGEPFTQGVNLELVTRRPDGRFQVVVYERGVGRTLACGTGACAVGAILIERGDARVGHPIDVFLPGGPLQITLDASGGASMRGPARRVFEGRMPLPADAWRRR